MVTVVNPVVMAVAVTEVDDDEETAAEAAALLGMATAPQTHKATDDDDVMDEGKRNVTKSRSTDTTSSSPFRIMVEEFSDNESHAASEDADPGVNAAEDADADADEMAARQSAGKWCVKYSAAVAVRKHDTSGAAPGDASCRT